MSSFKHKPSDDDDGVDDSVVVDGEDTPVTAEEAEAEVTGVVGRVEAGTAVEVVVVMVPVPLEVVEGSIPALLSGETVTWRY